MIPRGMRSFQLEYSTAPRLHRSGEITDSSELLITFRHSFGVNGVADVTHHPIRFGDYPHGLRDY